MNSNVNNGQHEALTIGPPLDYSFQELHFMKDVLDREPSGGKAKKKAPEKDEENANQTNLKIIVDTSNKRSMNMMNNGAAGAGGASGGHAPNLSNAADDRDSKIHLELETRAIKLSYNHLKQLSGFDDAVHAVMHNPSRLYWLDVSHNNLEDIDDELLKYSQLRVLYLHGNHICKLTQLRKLKRLPNLLKLTLHGNPVEENRNYRKFVINALPNLLSLDFIRITPRDRELATVWNQIRTRQRVARFGHG